MIRKFVVLLMTISFASPLLLAGCNTMQGAGADVESAGKKLKDEANEHKHY